MLARLKNLPNRFESSGARNRRAAVGVGDTAVRCGSTGRWLSALVLASVCACHHGEDQGAIDLPGMWSSASDHRRVRPRPPEIVQIRGSVAYASDAGRTSKVYLEVVNPSQAADVLIGVRSPIASQALIHAQHGPVLAASGPPAEAPTNAPIEALDKQKGATAVPPEGRLALRRGGTYIELRGIAKPLVEEQWIALVLDFERSGSIPISVPVLVEGKSY